MQVKQANIWMILFLICLTACSQEKNEFALFEHPNYDFPYQLAKPDQIWKLPESLVEISGLSFTDNHKLACIQDENGVIYIFDPIAGKVELEISFGDHGDYEGIEIIKNDAWILKSNGTLYQVTDYLEKAGLTAKRYRTALSARNNTEGLAYDPVKHNLLIACKGHPFVDEKQGKDHKAIYSFNLETKRMDINPFLLIPMDTIRYYKDHHAMTRLGIDLLSYSVPSQGDVTFAPSGIAIHPATGDIYMIGSVGKLLLVLSGKGEMLAMVNLSPKIFSQPEGICFSPDGILYIANEGDGRAGTILKFEPTDK